ncbi:hypothetical protein P168DRAFT_276928 [Aspergillus campestris IBT 28561]|uniref:F-box domain-containing protein n=1 Tax=Aspergillus campestris (strain IBT 28561) TaxID=1392248 RepID=A0A2I1CQU4_ASPC2|nr:uncharacterized protein P168DRAFT_276928 [Aspergillus campestris IBT 28561]PKY00001.1 hypothetical protein P168DRAFT_276928 [Aspergillus campestris IBT 28561]
MSSTTEKAFSIYELSERILLCLDNYLEIIRAQRVCCTWRDVIQTSPALQGFCWYRPNNIKDTQTQSISGEEGWILNPAFNRMAVSISKNETCGVLHDQGNFTLKERIYDKPGSWTTMLATQPPCQRMVVEFNGDYSDDDILSYLILSTHGYLLAGDVMAVLAECQNRVQHSLDITGVTYHEDGQLIPWFSAWWDSSSWLGLREIPDDVSIKVASELSWGMGSHPVFSLQRLDNQNYFLHEMIIYNGQKYQGNSSFSFVPSCTTEYEANLLVVREHQKGYLSDCSHIYRLLSDIE